jgi:hypothetical protein
VSRRPVAAWAGAVVLVLAGCGDGGAPRLSRAEYQRRGNVICTDYSAAIHRLGKAHALTDIAPFIRDALPVLSRAVVRLGRLRPPRALDGAFADFLGAMRATQRRDVALRDAAQKANGEAVQQLLDDAASSGQRTAALARRAGLDACAFA